MFDMVANTKPVSLSDMGSDTLKQEFQASFKKLGAFKKIREDHEKRGLLQKAWDFLTLDDTMEEAQLDAVQAQAEFSQILAKLMAVSIIQAQKLESQQLEICDQQVVIKHQAERIEAQASKIASQQEELASQNANLEKLVRDHFELRGLTMEGAKKLVGIAREVKQTSDSLSRTVSEQIAAAMSRVDAQSTEARARADRLDAACASALTVLNERSAGWDSRVSAQGARVSEIAGEVEGLGRRLGRLWIAAALGWSVTGVAIAAFALSSYWRS